jgi:mRNA-degrading endonuclease RelE of RelBE toxin-antitoxin system
MQVKYREAFLRDLKKLKKQAIYQEVYEIVFTALPQAKTLQDIPRCKALEGYPKRYRIRVGDYRIGLHLEGQTLQVMRVLHRREFYRYFP